MSPPEYRTFAWQDCAQALAPFAEDAALVVDAKRRFFASEALRVHPPLVLPIPQDCRSLAQYLATLPEQPGRHTLVLMQAGAVSLGLFEGGEKRATKSFRRYVVRGKGRAQPLHLQTKGKSRYGSRLRLQNARLLLQETIEKLAEWEAEYGPPDQVYYSAPIRLWAGLFAGKVLPPFEKEAAIRIPRDLPKPTTEILLRAYRGLGYGRIEEISGGSGRSEATSPL
jgi:hypothetical protein